MALLGKPDQHIGNADGSSEWLYGSPLKRISLRVEFSQDDHMIQHGYNGLTTGEIKGALYWGVVQVCDQVGASNEARDMKFKATCATMGWEGLQIRCYNKAEITRLNEEITAFWHSRGSLIPYFSAWSETSADPTVRNVIVTVSSKSGLEDYLRERGFTPE